VSPHPRIFWEGGCHPAPGKRPPLTPPPERNHPRELETAVRPDILDVVVKYPRLRQGKPVLCGAANKVTYDDEASAEAASSELAGVSGHAQRAYACDRKSDAHWHLTSRLAVCQPRD
jgi:hypothetical protein